MASSGRTVFDRKIFAGRSSVEQTGRESFCEGGGGGGTKGLIKSRMRNLPRGLRIMGREKEVEEEGRSEFPVYFSVILKSRTRDNAHAFYAHVNEGRGKGGRGGGN